MSDVEATGLDVSVLNAVVEEGDLQARLVLVRQLAKLIRDEATPVIEREQIIPILLKLTVDEERDVRKALISNLIHEKQIHSDIVFSIIADDDDLALPFLAQTPALNAWHFMAILRVGDEARQRVLAGRDDLTDEAADYVVKSSPATTVLALMENPIVLLEGADCHMIYQRFGHTAEVVEVLLALRDLPLEIRITQAKRAASRMRQLMAERGWVAANDASELVADAEENAILRVLAEASDGERAKATAYLASQNMLTPVLVVRAAAMGEMRIVEAALAHLSGHTQQKAVEHMYARNTMGFKSIFKRSGLPTSCFGILKAACDIVIDAKDEGLPVQAEEFGRRLLESLMTRYEYLSTADRARQVEFIGRYAQERVRKIAKRLKADMVRAA